MFDCNRYIIALLRVRLLAFNKEIVLLGETVREMWWQNDVPRLKEWLAGLDTAYEMTRGFHGLDRVEFDKKWEQTLTIVGTTHQDLIFLIPNDFEELSTVPANAPALYELLSGMSTHHINAFIHWCSIFLLARGFWYSASEGSWCNAEDDEPVGSRIYDIIKGLGLSGGNDALALGDLVRGWLENGLPESLRAACHDYGMDQDQDEVRDQAAFVYGGVLLPKDSNRRKSKCSIFETLFDCVPVHPSKNALRYGRASTPTTGKLSSITAVMNFPATLGVWHCATRLIRFVCGR